MSPSNNKRSSMGSTYSSKKHLERKRTLSSADDESINQKRGSGSPKPKKDQKSAPGEDDDDADDDSDDDPAEAEWEVTCIKKHIIKSGRVKYKVGWKGFTSEEDTWEPENNLTGAQELLKEYKLQHPELQSSSRNKARSSKGRNQSDDEMSETDPPASRKRKRPLQESKPKSVIAPLRKNGINGPTKADRDSVKNRQQPSKRNGYPESDAESNASSIDDDEWMAQYKDYASWEDLVKSVRTINIESSEDPKTGSSDSGEIHVCLLWKCGKSTWVTNKIARKKIPQKLLNFYEAHLQFTTNDPEA